MDKILTLTHMINESDKIVFFGGAGVSTESGIPDFRSATGIYSMAPEDILSKETLFTKPDVFFEFYRDKLINLEARPNNAHDALAQLEEMGKLTTIITQNIDGLHQMAGSQSVIELHGSIYENYCVNCMSSYDVNHVVESTEITPRCTKCGGIIRPSATLFGEKLDEENMLKAIDAITNADMLIVGGTSLVVSPAAGLIRHYSGDRLVIINMSETKRDRKANLVIRDKVGTVLKQVTK